jgi:hypothetical protein
VERAMTGLPPKHLAAIWAAPLRSIRVTSTDLTLAAFTSGGRQVSAGSDQILTHAHPG